MGTDDGEPYVLKRKVSPGEVDVHPTESALIVNYTVQATIQGEDGLPVIGDKKGMQKIIRVKSLSGSSDLSALAQEIVDKCKLISPSRQKAVEQQLYYLQQRKITEGGGESDKSIRRQQLEEQKRWDEDMQRQELETDESVSMDQVDRYIELLYEEIPEKIRGTRCIQRLARITENLEALCENEALMSALARVLREDGKRSMDLVINIVQTFFCFSNYTQFHPYVTANKMGDMCLKIVDQEAARYMLWSNDLERYRIKCEQNPESKEALRELEHENRKMQNMLKKQDQLLFVTFHLLLNLAEDLTIEVKMVKRKIVDKLITLLIRQTPELLILLVTFLKKLSVFRENKDEMIQHPDLLPRISRLIPCSHPGLLTSVLRLVLNLSHDPSFRDDFVKQGLCTRLVDLLATKQNQILVLSILYMLSSDDRSRSLMTYTDLVPLVMKLVYEQKGDRLGIELAALVVNMATHARSAQMMCEEGGLKFLMKRALKTRDPLLAKVVKTIAMHDGATKMMFLDYIDDIMTTLRKCSMPEMTVELLGILSSLTISEFDFAKLAESYNMIDFIQSRLASAVHASGGGIDSNAGAAPLNKSGGKGTNAIERASVKKTENNLEGPYEGDDVTLETIVFLGTMANDEHVAPLIANSNIIQLLLELMSAKEEDDETILQSIYAVYQFLLHEDTQNVLLNQTQVVSYLIDLLYDRNVEIRKLCDVCLDLIAEISEEWSIKIKHQKFRWHNQEWLSLLARTFSTANSKQNTRPTVHKSSGKNGSPRKEVDDPLDAESSFKAAVLNGEIAKQTLIGLGITEGKGNGGLRRVSYEEFESESEGDDEDTPVFVGSHLDLNDLLA